MSALRILFLSVLIGGLIHAQSLSETPAPDSATPPVKQDATPEIAALRAAYDAAVAANEAERPKWVAGLENWYVDGLGKLLTERTKAGDLDGALMIKAERERITAHTETSAAQIEAMPVTLRTLRGNYDAALKKISEEIAKRNLPAGQKLLADMEALQKKITVSGDLDRALMVKAEKERFAAQLANGGLASIAPSPGIRASTPIAVKPPAPATPPGTFTTLDQIINSAPVDSLLKLENKDTVEEGIAEVNDYLARSVKGKPSWLQLEVNTTGAVNYGANKYVLRAVDHPVATSAGGSVRGRLRVYFRKEAVPVAEKVAVGAALTVSGVIDRCLVTKNDGLQLNIDLRDCEIEKP